MRRNAGFIPQKLWKKILKEWVRFTRMPWTSQRDVTKDAIKWAQSVRDRLLKLAPQSRAAFNIKKLSKKLEWTIRKQIEYLSSYHEDLDDLHEERRRLSDPMARQIAGILPYRLDDELAEKRKGMKVYDALNYSWRINIKKMMRDARKYAKSPGNDPWEILNSHHREWDKQNYIQRKRRDPSGITAVEWVLDEIENVLEFQSTEKGLEKDLAYTEFDFHGVKVVLDDLSIDYNARKRVIQSVDKVYQLLQAKGLLKHVWWGEVFIRCENCGGINKHTGGGVGGNYHIGPDTVNVFTEDAYGVADVLAHELGHRYWFKGMTKAQRMKFKSLVQTKGEKKQPPSRENRPEESLLEEQKEVLENQRQKILQKMEKGTEGGRAENLRELDIRAAGSLYESFLNILKASFYQWKSRTKVDTPELRQLERETLGELDQIGPEMISLLRKWKFLDAQDLLTKADHIASDALDEVWEINKQAWDDAWDEFHYGKKDLKPVSPVSDYGRHNAEEAFAEAFLHYVMNRDMNRDQIDSFKAVLKRASNDMVMRVAMEYALVRRKRVAWTILR